MFKLSFITLALLLSMNILAIQSPHGVNLSMKCDVCHNTDGWNNIKKNAFNHDQTAFPLIGQHKLIDCRKCHVDLVFSNAKTACNSCHTDVHQQTVGQDCERCHNEQSWIVQNIKVIHDQSKFPLRGIHAQIDCYQCHKSASLLRFDPMHTECIDCHLKDYNATTSPSHVATRYSKDCTLCHDEKTWFSATFDHNTTAFPLTGSHIGVYCIRCHANGYTAIPTTCVSCHLTNFNATTNPNHITAKFSTDCQTCHNVIAWQPSTFNHNTTAFPLTGSHIGVACVTCHANGYTAIPSTCVSCHQANYNATTNPNHLTNKFSTDCQTCHNVTAWQPSTFNHNTTAFPLTGSHIGVDCIKCHASGYISTPSTCVSCHQANFNATTNPNHLTNKFSTDCQTCHNVTAWQPSTFNHNTTAFPLTGSHIGVACVTCHTNGYTAIPSTCVSCHQANYNATTNPNHLTNKFSTDCQTCHNVTAW
ncbi:MAG TPA: cytochrome c3 family protein, partial [Paludibacter sp.]